MVKKKIVTVREHSRNVPVSKKNPTGVTIVDKHSRHLHGTFLDINEIEKTVKNYNLRKIIFPKADKLEEYPNSDKYDDLIAIWTDYFNNKFPSDSLLDPDVVKALIGSESDFELDPKNPLAIGIAQITKETFKSLKDPKGETKDFIFIKITLKDLKNPDIAIPMAIRWLFRKKRLAQGKLGKEPTAEEIILEYKGLLKSKSQYKDKAITKFRKLYERLKK